MHAIYFPEKLLPDIKKGLINSTVRLMRPQPGLDYFKGISGSAALFESENHGDFLEPFYYRERIRCPYGTKGDILRVRHTFTDANGIRQPGSRMLKSQASLFLKIENIKASHAWHGLSESDIRFHEDFVRNWNREHGRPGLERNFGNPWVWEINFRRIRALECCK